MSCPWAGVGEFRPHGESNPGCDRSLPSTGRRAPPLCRMERPARSDGNAHPPRATPQGCAFWKPHDPTAGIVAAPRAPGGPYDRRHDRTRVMPGPRTILDQLTLARTARCPWRSHGTWRSPSPSRRWSWDGGLPGERLAWRCRRPSSRRAWWRSPSETGSTDWSLDCSRSRWACSRCAGAGQDQPGRVHLDHNRATAAAQASGALGTLTTAARPSWAVTTAIRASDATFTPSRNARASGEARSLRTSGPLSATNTNAGRKMLAVETSAPRGLSARIR